MDTLTEFDVDPHPTEPEREHAPRRSSTPAADAALDAKIRAVPVVRGVETQIWRLKVEREKAVAAQRAANRAGFRDQMLGKPVSADVYDTADAIQLLDGLLAGASDCLIFARDEAIGTLEKALEQNMQPAHAAIEAAKKKFDRQVRGGFLDGELPPKSNVFERNEVVERSRIAEGHSKAQLSALGIELSTLRSERARLRRENAALFAAEGVK